MTKLCRFLLVFALGLWAFSARADILVSLRPAAEVKGPSIRLSDVFDGVTKDVDTDIALAPEPGKSVTYNVQVLTQLADQYHLIWKPQNQADAALLHRASIDVTPDMIREKIVEKIKAVETRSVENMDVTFESRQVGFALPAEQSPVFDLADFSYDARSRRFRTEIIARSGPSPVRQILMGRVSFKRDVPVLAHHVAAQTVLGAGDIAWRQEAEDRLPRDVATDAAQLVGMEMRGDGDEGDLIRMRDLLPARLVTRGSLVTIKIETPLMQVTVRGRSLSDGAKGDVVRVTNLQSKRVIEGVVESDGVVRIDLARTVASAE